MAVWNAAESSVFPSPTAPYLKHIEDLDGTRLHRQRPDGAHRRQSSAGSRGLQEAPPCRTPISARLR